MGELEKALEHIVSAQLEGAVQEAYRTQMTEFCWEHSDALYRSCLRGHLTGSAAIFDPSRGACLVMHHVKLDRWLQPGGHADGEGDLQAVALREAEEETGLEGLQVVAPAIDLDIHRIPERPGEPEHLHLDVRFLVLCPAGAQPKGNHESHALSWWHPAMAELALDESTSRLLTRAMTFLG